MRDHLGRGAGARLLRSPSERLGPAGWVTLGRATFVIGVSALTADSFDRDVPAAMLVTLATMAGHLLRRRMGRAKDRHDVGVGARLDGEVDASSSSSSACTSRRSVGVGCSRSARPATCSSSPGGCFRWMRAPLPRRDWRKVVAATQGIVLTIAAAGVVPPRLMQAALVVALALLAESFGRDVWWLWRHRHAADHATRRPPRTRPCGHRRGGHAARPRRGVGRAHGSEPAQPLTPAAFVRLPLEGIVVIALALVLPGTGRRLLAWVVGRRSASWPS